MRTRGPERVGRDSQPEMGWRCCTCASVRVECASEDLARSAVLKENELLSCACSDHSFAAMPRHTHRVGGPQQRSGGGAAGSSAAGAHRPTMLAFSCCVLCSVCRAVLVLCTPLTAHTSEALSCRDTAGSRSAAAAAAAKPKKPHRFRCVPGPPCIWQVGSPADLVGAQARDGRVAGDTQVPEINRSSDSQATVCPAGATDPQSCAATHLCADASCALRAGSRDHTDVQLDAS